MLFYRLKMKMVNSKRYGFQIEELKIKLEEKQREQEQRKRRHKDFEM